ncbi:MAG: hypothetical protein P8M78_08745 [Myxococcota bacterium]|nr:hypothetical protein [Myxococcota bacterium]
MHHDEQVRQIRKLIARLGVVEIVDAGGLHRNPTAVDVDCELAEREWQSVLRAHPQLIGLSGDLHEQGSS